MIGLTAGLPIQVDAPRTRLVPALEDDRRDRLAHASAIDRTHTNSRRLADLDPGDDIAIDLR